MERSGTPSEARAPGARNPFHSAIAASEGHFEEDVRNEMHEISLVQCAQDSLRDVTGLLLQILTVSVVVQVLSTMDNRAYAALVGHVSDAIAGATGGMITAAHANTILATMQRIVKQNIAQQGVANARGRGERPADVRTVRDWCGVSILIGGVTKLYTAMTERVRSRHTPVPPVPLEGGAAAAGPFGGTASMPTRSSSSPAAAGAPRPVTPASASPTSTASPTATCALHVGKIKDDLKRRVRTIRETGSVCPHASRNVEDCEVAVLAPEQFKELSKASTATASGREEEVDYVALQAGLGKAPISGSFDLSTSSVDLVKSLVGVMEKRASAVAKFVNDLDCGVKDYACIVFDGKQIIGIDAIRLTPDSVVYSNVRNIVSRYFKSPPAKLKLKTGGSNMPARSPSAGASTGASSSPSTPVQPRTPRGVPRPAPVDPKRRRLELEDELELGAARRDIASSTDEDMADFRRGRRQSTGRAPTTRATKRARKSQ